MRFRSLCWLACGFAFGVLANELRRHHQMEIARPPVLERCAALDLLGFVRVSRNYNPEFELTTCLWVHRVTGKPVLCDCEQ